MARALVNQANDNRKNYLINGDMRISQRGTLFTSIIDNQYSLDRWKYNKSGAMVHSLAQDTDVPTVAQANYFFVNSLLATVTTIDGSIAAGDYCVISQRVEGYNYANLAQRPMVLGFWVKSSIAGTYCVALTNAGANRSIVAEYTVNSVNTWEYKSIQFAASPAAGTWDYTNGIGLAVKWTLAAGTTYQTTAGSWNVGDFLATANQVNQTGTIVAAFRITGATLTEGAAPSAFRLFNGDLQGELAACQRYYEKSYTFNTNPGSLTQAGAVQFGAGTTTHRDSWSVFKVEKRTASPSIGIYSPDTGAGGAARNRSAASDVGVSIGDSGATRFNISFAPNAGQHYSYHWTAETEL